MAYLTRSLFLTFPPFYCQFLNSSILRGDRWLQLYIHHNISYFFQRSVHFKFFCHTIKHKKIFQYDSVYCSLPNHLFQLSSPTTVIAERFKHPQLFVPFRECLILIVIMTKHWYQHIHFPHHRGALKLLQLDCTIHKAGRCKLLQKDKFFDS